MQVRSNPNSIYEPPYTKQHKKESVAVFLIMALSLVFFIQNLEVLWFICIIIISAAILLVIRCYPKEYDPWKHPISDIKLLEIITICIAILQLVLAYPQLKNSYKSATSADIEKLRSSSKEIEDSFEGLVISSIPDSLITEEAKIAISFRANLFYRLKNLCSIEISNNDMYAAIDEKPDFDRTGLSKRQIKDSIAVFYLQNLYKSISFSCERAIFFMNFSQSLSRCNLQICESLFINENFKALLVAHMDISQLAKMDSDHEKKVGEIGNKADEICRKLSKTKNKVKFVSHNPIVRLTLKSDVKKIEKLTSDMFQSVYSTTIESVEIYKRTINVLNSIIYSEIYDIEGASSELCQSVIF